MKRLIFLLTVLALLCGCADARQEGKSNEDSRVSAVWIYYNELSMAGENGGSEKAFAEKADKMFDNCLKYGINTVFVQVRPCGDALYDSHIYPWSAYVTGEQGKNPGYDPLEILVERGRASGISVHAWINPFRIAFKDDVNALSKDNPALKWMNSSDRSKSANVVKVNGGLYYCPASTDVQRLVIDGVREIIRRYGVDGIHIDDYFYPSTDSSTDAVFYKEYRDGGGTLPLKTWRLNIISSFVSAMYSAVKSEDENCIFSVSPAGNVKNNYNEQYADVGRWCSESGFADWIIPQIYFGFDDKALTFDDACDEWDRLARGGKVRLICGIAAYKVNNSDEEWKSGGGIIARQLQYAEERVNYSGTAFFSYSGLTDPAASAEFGILTGQSGLTP